MSNDPNKRPVRVSYSNSDKVRTVHVQRQMPDGSAPTQPTKPEGSIGPPPSAPMPLTRPQSQEMPAEELAPAAPASATVSAESVPVNADGNTPGQKGAGATKSKLDIETLEQFIEYAYGRKGQRVGLKPKVEKAIAQNPRLEDGAMSRLLALAAGDTLLAVPRQLLLVSRDVDGNPTLRAALSSFVSTVIQRHPAFADPGVQGALRNLPDALSPADALAKVAAFSPADEDGNPPVKGADLHALRRNAAHLFATWLASNRGMNGDELAALLFQVMWSPAARDLADDNSRLRALTEIEQPAGVGLACQRFRQQALEARTSQDQALRDANDLRLRLAETDGKRLLAEEQRDALAAELHALRESSAAEATELRRQHEVERTHLRHDQEQLRGRMVRRLDEGVEMLEVGLTALRNKTPRVEVMLERAEHVVDALRAEIKNLSEE